MGEDGAEEGHVTDFVAAVGGPDHLDGGDGAEGNVGESFGEEDGAGEIGDWEAVLAGGDGRLARGVEDGVCTDGVDLLLLELGLAGQRSEVVKYLTARMAEMALMANVLVH